MEVVSPRLETSLHVSRILSDFWEAMRVHFNPQRDPSCGGHVHVTPVSFRNKFKLSSLKKIAFAAVVYEDFVASMLAPSRRDNQFCKLNSQSVDSGLRETLLWGKSTGSLKQVAAEIRGLSSETDLYMYMQGNRYVLWNFQNIFPHPKTGRCTGTVEFRGGNQFLNTKGTLAWVAFVLGFITLAIKEVCRHALFLLLFLDGSLFSVPCLIVFHSPSLQVNTRTSCFLCINQNNYCRLPCSLRKSSIPCLRLLLTHPS